nr:immunoglobulin light chain junction region [Macaca mulatta]
CQSYGSSLNAYIF